MKRFFSIICTFIALATTSCASKYDYQSMQAPTVQLDSEKAVLISAPPNGNYTTTVYEKSGEMTAKAFANSFGAYASEVAIADDCHGSDCLKTNPKQYGYYVEPTILHWEDRATEWSGRLDRIQIEMTVYEMATKKQLDKSSFAASSKWATLGGDHPEDLLHDPLKRYVASLY